jgi:serine/threonine protein kinase
MLSDGQVVAIKRAQQGSMQGGLEFKTEIELLSRVHHKNLVGLVGFCFEQGEQMLVYEYMPNGTLRECLSGIYAHSTLAMQVSIETMHAKTFSNFQFNFFWPTNGHVQRYPGEFSF